MVRVGVVRFPGTNNEHETMEALQMRGAEAVLVPQFQPHLLRDMDGIYIPGGFSYGDYLRPGVVPKTTELGQEIMEEAANGKPILGVCNGFQILTEMSLLPGVLAKNLSTRFICKWVHAKIVAKKGFLADLHGEVFFLPIAHYSGLYFDEETRLQKTVNDKNIAIQYSESDGRISEGSNPNGSLLNIAGVSDSQGTIVGMMPHPERAVTNYHRSRDGAKIIDAFLEALKC